MRRYGRIEVYKDLHKEAFGLEALKLVFANFVPIDMVHHINGTIIFYGLSDHFEEVTEGSHIPHYDVVVTEGEDKSLTIEFKKS
jgi:hypothetical protein